MRGTDAQPQVRWQFSDDGTGLTLYDADGDAIGSLKENSGAVNLEHLDSMANPRSYVDLADDQVTVNVQDATASASATMTMGSGGTWTIFTGDFTTFADTLSIGGGSGIGFWGSTGLINESRPAIPTQVVAVDVDDFNALRTALIAVGLITDGD